MIVISLIIVMVIRMRMMMIIIAYSCVYIHMIAWPIDCAVMFDHGDILSYEVGCMGSKWPEIGPRGS